MRLGEQAREATGAPSLIPGPLSIPLPTMAPLATGDTRRVTPGTVLRLTTVRGREALRGALLAWLLSTCNLASGKGKKDKPFIITEVSRKF